MPTSDEYSQYIVANGAQNQIEIPADGTQYPGAMSTPASPVQEEVAPPVGDWSVESAANRYSHTAAETTTDGTQNHGAMSIQASLVVDAADTPEGGTEMGDRGVGGEEGRGREGTEGGPMMGLRTVQTGEEDGGEGNDPVEAAETEAMVTEVAETEGS